MSSKKSFAKTNNKSITKPPSKGFLSARQQRDNKCQLRENARLKKIIALLKILERILIYRGITVTPREIQASSSRYDTVYEFKTNIAGQTVDIGFIQCNLSDLSVESSSSIDMNFTRLLQQQAQRSEEEIPALQVSYIDVVPRFQGHGYGALLFAYGILKSIQENSSITKYFLADCSDNSTKIRRNLYTKFAQLKETYSNDEQSKILELQELDTYFESAIHRIAREEILRRQKKDAFIRHPSFNSVDTSSSFDSESESESNSDSESDTGYVSEEREAADTSIAQIDMLLNAVEIFVNNEEIQMQRRIGSGGKRKTLKKRRKRTVKKRGKRTNRKKKC